MAGGHHFRHRGSTHFDGSLEAWPLGWRHSPTSKHRRKSSLRQYPCDFLSLIPLNFNPPFLHRSTNATRLLHFLRELLFLWQTNAHEVLHHRHRPAAPSGFHANDVHATSRLARRVLRTSRWKTSAVQIGKWIVEVAHTRSLYTRYSMSMSSRDNTNSSIAASDAEATALTQPSSSTPCQESAATCIPARIEGDGWSSDRAPRRTWSASMVDSRRRATTIRPMFFRLSDIKSSITWTPHQSWREPSGFLRSISCEFPSNSRGRTWSNTIMK